MVDKYNEKYNKDDFRRDEFKLELSEIIKKKAVAIKKSEKKRKREIKFLCKKYHGYRRYLECIMGNPLYKFYKM